MGLPHSFYYYFLHFLTLSSSTIVFSIWLNFFLFHYVPVAAVVLFNPPRSIHPRQDLTATPTRVNSSGHGLSSPAPKQPSTKPFSGLPSGCKVTSAFREAGEAQGERPGIVYPLLPCATRPDTRLFIDVAMLPKSAALSRQARLPTVLDLEKEDPREKENQPPSQSRRQQCKRRRNRSTGVYRPPKLSPP